jgi:transposase
MSLARAKSTVVVIPGGWPECSRFRHSFVSLAVYVRAYASRVLGASKMGRSCRFRGLRRHRRPFSKAAFLYARDLVQVKYEMVRRVRLEGQPVSHAARAFGFSRPSFYQAQAALEAGGLQALVPARPGPRRAHKLTQEVVGFLRERLEADRSLRAPALAALVAERFGVRVHPRSIERALRRAAQPKSEGER